MTSLLADFDSDIRRAAVLLLAFVIITTLSFGLAALRRRSAARMGENWDQIQGTIEQTDVIVEDRGKLSVYVAQLRYSYRVTGGYRSGEFTKDFLREHNAYSFADSFPSGTQVTIRCHPDNVHLSVFREEDNASLMSASHT
jgi:hypothetical protein